MNLSYRGASQSVTESELARPVHGIGHERAPIRELSRNDLPACNNKNVPLPENNETCVLFRDPSAGTDHAGITRAARHYC